MSSLVGGVDEAGRGCMVGPLVVAGVSVSPSRLVELRSLGVKDSKLLSSRRRETLFPEIVDTCERVRWAMIAPSEIDVVVRTGKRLKKLNFLEAVYFARVIDQLGARSVTVDASDVIPRRFRDNIKQSLSVDCRVRAAHKADRDHPAVSAASIVAKVLRDAEVEALREVHGDFGSGYPSDPTTRRFFSEMVGRGGPLPEYVRKSWKTWDRLGALQALLT